MQDVGRHIGVFCLLFAGDGLVSFAMPLDMSAGLAFTAAMLTFIAYMGVSYLRAGRWSKNG